MNKWDELKKFVEQQLNFEDNSERVKPEWERYMDEGVRRAFIAFKNEMELLERKEKEDIENVR